MKFFDIGQEANGFIAIGQIATGFIAIGQMATGVIAIGQVARGFFAVGMLSIGLFSIGMLSFGVFGGMAMLGASGLGGKGIMIPLMPFPGMRAFDLVKADQIFGGRQKGFVRGRLVLEGGSTPRFEADGRVTEAVVTLGLTQAARVAAASAKPEVVAYIEPQPDGRFVIERLIGIPPGMSSVPLRFVIRTLALLALAAICVGFYVAVAIPLVELLVSTK